MAATRLIPLHINKGKSALRSLADRTDYAKNPEKTRKGELVTTYECDPMTVEEDFMLSRRQYQHQYGREPKSDIIAYQIRQSFKPGEIDAEEANRLGRELALRFTKGEHAFLVATHTDKAHIHNHIVFNSISVNGEKKFRNFYNSAKALQRESDMICLENGLSVIEPASYEERSKRTTFPERKSNRQIICDDIDKILSGKPKDLPEFIRKMKDLGYECKEGKHLAFRKEGMERFIRLDSLHEGYKEADIHEEINDHAPELAKQRDQKVSLLINIQEKMKTKGASYERWAKTYNLKQMAKSLLFLRDHNIESLEELDSIVAEKTEKRDALLVGVKASEARLSEIATLKTHIINYSKTKETYSEYRKSGYSKNFYEEHRAEIILHKAAKQAFDELGVKKIPRVKDLSAEYAEVLASKKEQYEEYRKLRDESKEILAVQRNIESLYEAENQSQDQKRRKEERTL